jgi:hypothetical protein
MNYKELMRRFIKALIVTTVLVVIVGVIFFANVPGSYYTLAFPYLLVFFFVASMLVYHFILKSVEKRPAKFVNVFMLTTMLKLFAYMGFMITYALLNREDARAFIVTFFVLYVIYTIVEVISLLRVNRDYAK